MSELTSLRLSHSSRNTFHGCEQKFYFYKFFPQPKNFMDGYAAMVGKALHRGWQHYLVHRDPDASIAELMFAWDLKILGGKYEARTLEAAFSTLLALQEQVDRDIEWSLAYIVVDGERRPATEVPFQINFMRGGKPFEIRPGLPVTYIGFIDAILHSNLTGRLRVRDLKTHREWTDDLTAKYMFDEQCIPYSLVMERAVGNEIRNFEIEYLSAYVDVAAPNIVPYVFQKGESLIQDWAKGLYFDLMLLQNYLQADWFPRRSSHCLAYGNQLCKFYEPCQTRNPAYWKEYFALGRELVYQEVEFKPWFTLELELGDDLAVPAHRSIQASPSIQSAEVVGVIA